MNRKDPEICVGPYPYFPGNCRKLTADNAELLLKEWYMTRYHRLQLDYGHKDYCLVLTLKGEAILSIGDGRTRLRAGEFVLFRLQPGVVLNISRGYSRLIAGGFNKELLEKAVGRFKAQRTEPMKITSGEAEDLRAFVETLAERPEKKSLSITGSVTTITARFIHEHLFRNTDQPESADTCLMAILQLCLHEAARAGKKAFIQKERDLVSAGIAFIENAPPGEFSIRSLCLALNASESTIRRSFIRETGMKLQEHILLVKLRKSRELLLQLPLIEIKAIAYLLGFSSPSQFSVFIKKHLGLSPTGYREKHLLPKEKKPAPDEKTAPPD